MLKAIASAIGVAGVGSSFFNSRVLPFAAMARCRVVSIGYERRAVSDFVATLVEHSVRRLIDVRAVPLSRRSEYRKSALEQTLKAAGIQYVHVREAGNPYREGKEDRDKCLAAYRRHISRSPAALRAIGKMLMTTSTVAVLCYERDHAECHRSVLLDVLQKSGRDLRVIAVE